MPDPLEVGDVLLSSEAPLGCTGRITAGLPRLCLGQRLFALRPKPGLVDSRFLEAALHCDPVRGRLLARASGTTAQGIRQSELRQVLIPLPPLTEQRAIASVLGALDDKIESNRRLASVLAEVVLIAADHASRTASRRESVAAFVEQVRLPGDPARPYLGLDVMPRGSTILGGWDEREVATGASWSFEPGDVLFGKLRPYFRKVAVAPMAGRCSREILVLRPSSPEYYGLVIGTIASKAFCDFATAISTGTKMPRAEWKDASKFEVGVPDGEMLDELTDIATKNYALATAASRETQVLTAIRDALLPKLVSGKIRVPLDSDTEKQVA
ncbi:MAG: restriction endonuclease subunit S [Solirubrobacterales bacterium]